MNKSATRAFSLILVCCMLVCGLPTAVFAAGSTTESTVQFVGQQLNLNDDLTMKFYVSVESAQAESTVMEITVADTVKNYALSEMTPNEDGNYVFPVDMAAAQMTDNITLVLKDGETVLGEKTYRIRDYAEALLTGNFSNETKQMVKQMLNYGAKAQQYFAYREGDLANAGYELEAADEASVPAEAMAIPVEGVLNGIAFYSATLVFQSRIAVRYYFVAPDGVEGFTFRANGVDYTANAKAGMYYVEIPEINPQSMSDLIELTVSDGTDSMKIGYSPLHYITRMYNKTETTPALKTLLQAIYGYHLAAVDFVGVFGDYDNGIDLDKYISIGTLFENDFSEDANKGVDAAWKKSAFNDSTPALEDGKLRLTSTEHLFVYGMHAWGQYGGVGFAKGATYKMSLNLKQGSDDCNDVFNLYVMTENGDPRYGNIVNTLSLDFSNNRKMVTQNTNDFASVSFDYLTGVVHIEALFTADSSANTQIVSRCAGTNNWLLDDLTFEKVIENVDYDNGVVHEGNIPASTTLANDFSENVDKGAENGRTAYFGSTAALDNGWARITSSEHIFTYGGHAWGMFGGIILAKGATYQTSFDLKLGDKNANHTFTVYVMTENGDARFGNVVKTLTLNFADLKNFVTENTDNFAAVTYDAASQTAHVELEYTTDETAYTNIVSRCAGTNNWLLDNLKFVKLMPNVDYSNGISFEEYQIQFVKFDNDFSEDINKGVDQAWERSPFVGSTATLQDGWARITSDEHVFVYGGHTWAYYGGFSLDKDTTYITSFDLKLGDVDSNKVFNLYVMTENGDPRFGDVVNTLTLDFADLSNLVTVNTNDFASVTYTAATQTAHIEICYTTNPTKNTDIVSRCAGTNNWLLDNLTFAKVGIPQSYSNGISFDGYKTESILLANDFSEDVNKGVDAAWKKSAFYGSTAALDNGWARITSDEHIFTYGMHAWGCYGGAAMGKGMTYRFAFDLKLGDSTANKSFNLYVMTENGDPRFGSVQNTLTLNFDDIQNFVTANTADFASVNYDGKTGVAHIEILFTTDGSVNTLVVAKSNGTNNWLLDNLTVEKVTEVYELQSFGYNSVTLSSGLYKQTYDGCMDYYGQLTADDILYRWRKNAGMDTLTGRDLGWEKGPTNPECCIAQLISAKARAYAVSGNQADLQVVEDILNGFQEVIDTLHDYPGVYTAYFYEKTLRAFIDCYECCGLESGYQMAKTFVQYGMTTDKFANPSKLLGDNNTEWYTMGEALYQFAKLAKAKGESTAFVNQCNDFANLYMYNEFWNIFYNENSLFDYTVQVDNPNNQWFHAYSHMNSFNSAMEAYIQTKDSYYLDATKKFYQWAQGTQKLATGGYGVEREWLLPGNELVQYLKTSSNSTETQCNAYAIVNLDNRLMTVTGDASYGQWTEDAFYNMTIASLETRDGCAHYYSDYSTDGGCKGLRTDWLWACCAGTRPLVVMEYLKNIYFHDAQNLYVNLYTNSSVSFQNGAGNQVTLTQSSNFPVEDTVSFSVGTSFDQEFSISFRKPQWLASNAVVTVNGTAVNYDVVNGWIVVRRTWKNADVVQITLPMELRYSAINNTDATDYVYAVTYGPVVLACTGNNSTLAKYLPLSGDLNSLVTRQEGTLNFTVNSLPALTLKPYYAYAEGEAYTLYINPIY